MKPIDFVSTRDDTVGMNTTGRRDAHIPCPGAGTKWVPVWDRAYCRVCHRTRSHILGLPTNAHDWSSHRSELIPIHNIWRQA